MIRALLLTDVVDSTQLAEQLGDAAMAALWARHDRVARDLLPVHRGREIDKTDGFLLLFDAAGDAVAYAVAYHRAIRELGLRARAGLHVGPVVLTENAPADIARGAKPLEVDGLAKPTAARIMSLAAGGQTLLSAEARAALGPTLLHVESHGHWRMKGVAEPVELFEVGDEGAPFTPPPDAAKVYRVVRGGPHWLPAREVAHNLPGERDAFVGRAADLRQLARALDEGARLVSVLGIGGTGKTRLVTHHGWTWLGDYPGGAWFCDLSEARDVDGIAHAVARALDVPLGTGDPVVQLGHAIAGRGRCLVVLDNFEQVARHAGETLGRWLDRAREAVFVVTTREVLGLPGEQTLPLAPLVSEDGVDLFTARARQANPGFVPDDLDAIRALVKLLDGLPLAIELAAARVRLMPPKVLLQRMSERFKLLASTGGRHTRQATLRGALDWSWDLLSADEQAALGQLSVFEGGFTLEAAEGVLSLSELWPMDAVQALVDKSLVRQVSDERLDAVRMDLLVTVQEYAAEKLQALGGRSDAEERHAAWFARHGEADALLGLTSHGGAARLRALTAELDNLVAACRRSAARGAAEDAMRLLRAAWEVLHMTGPVAQALDLAERVAAMPGLSPGARAAAGGLRGRALDMVGRTEEARAVFTAALAAVREPQPDGTRDRRTECGLLLPLGILDCQMGRLEQAREHLEAALVIARELGHRRLEGSALSYLATLHQRQDRMAATREHLDGALAIAREVGNRRFEAMCLGNLAKLHFQHGRLDEAREHLEAALVIAREVGDRRTEGATFGSLGAVHATQGRLDEARPLFDANLTVARQVGDRLTEGHALGQLGLLHLEQGRMDAAREHFDAALAVHRDVGDRGSEGHVLGHLGLLHLEQGRMDVARAHFDAALAVHREVGSPRFEAQVLGHLGRLHCEQGRMDEARACFRSGEALLRQVGDLFSLGSVLCDRLHLERAEGRVEAARATLAEAEALALQAHAGPDSELVRDLAKARAALEAS